MWLSSSMDVRRVFAILVVITGTLAASFILSRMATIVNQGDVAARSRRLHITRTLEPGIYLGLIGGLIGLAGGVLSLVSMPLGADARRRLGASGWSTPEPRPAPTPPTEPMDAPSGAGVDPTTELPGLGAAREPPS
jgi:hypothetical protein